MSPRADQRITASSDELLPLPQLTPRMLLGGADSDREALGQLYASQIASAIVMRNKDEHRSVLLGLGFQDKEHDRQSFIDILELIGECL